VLAQLLDPRFDGDTLDPQIQVFVGNLAFGDPQVGCIPTSYLGTNAFMFVMTWYLN
jgi:hypothetical protein